MLRIQRSSALQLPKASIGRVIREVLQHESQKWNTAGYSITREALDAIRHSTESYATDMFKEADSLATHAGRHTIQKKDLRAAIERVPGVDILDLERESRTSVRAAVKP